MDRVILDNIPFEPHFSTLMRKLHVKEGSSAVKKLERLVQEAQPIARPKAVYREVYVESRGKDYVTFDGIKFSSRVLRVNLEQAHRVFIYVATGGQELDEWSHGIDDMLEGYWADAIAEMALRSATQTLKRYLIEHYRLGNTSSMSPGSLEDWPIQQQRVLFAALGDPEADIGVRLSDSLLMIPTKSLSGLRFPIEENFESCQLCPRDRCPGRRAKYDAELYAKKYESEAG